MRAPTNNTPIPADEAEPMDNPAEETAEPQDSGAMMEDCVPLDALAMPDESEQMENPAVGDKVQYTVEGTITRIEGGDAYVKKSAVNGQKIEDTEKPAAAEPTDDMAALESEAKGMSETPQY
jgi:hypothetical protein